MHTHLALDGRILVLKPAGHLLGGTETDEFVEVAREFAKSEHVALVIDLDDVDYMNSLALGALTRILVTFSNVNGRVKVCNLRDRVRKLFDVVKFHNLFVYYDSERAAVEALAKEMAKTV
jgi:anti-sigma B factor antagonist